MNNSKTSTIDFSNRMYSLGKEFYSKVGDNWSMVNPNAISFSAISGIGDDDSFNELFPIGAKISWVPILGEIIWELPQELAEQIPFTAYIFRDKNERKIGYLRVPHYFYKESDVNKLTEVIAHFENTTLAMVLDQVDNPGGNMFHMYALLSLLTDRALTLPKHQIYFNEDDIAIAKDTIELAEYGEEIPINERPSQELVEYSRSVLSEVEAGRGFSYKCNQMFKDKKLPLHDLLKVVSPTTNPIYLGGVTEILPSKIHYSKKIVVLINEIDFSASEFLAAILQDNMRAKLFGVRTAGAGGCVRRLLLQNELLGLDYVTYTWTIARRVNGQPIESIGVHPDIEYSITAEDIQFGFALYRQALLKSIDAELNNDLF